MKARIVQATIVPGLLLMAAGSITAQVTQAGLPAYTVKYTTTFAEGTAQPVFLLARRSDGSQVDGVYEQGQLSTKTILSVESKDSIHYDVVAHVAFVIPLQRYEYERLKTRFADCEEASLAGSCTTRAGVILGHPVDKVETAVTGSSDFARTVRYVAPGLNYLMLREEVYARDGRQVSAQVATDLLAGEPESSLFAIPAGSLQATSYEQYMREKMTRRGLELKEHHLRAAKRQDDMVRRWRESGLFMK